MASRSSSRVNTRLLTVPAQQRYEEVKHVQRESHPCLGFIRNCNLILDYTFQVLRKVKVLMKSIITEAYLKGLLKKGRNVALFFLNTASLHLEIFQIL